MVTNERVRWGSTTVGGQLTRYAAGGSGPTLLFLHGWALGFRSYQPVLTHLIRSGWRVLAPGMPGLSGTPDLPLDQRTLRGYAKWVAEFCGKMHADRALVVGHSFGGGVAIRLAYDYPELVSELVLVNSIGGSVWSDRRGIVSAMAKRPLWDWGLHLPADMLPLRQVTKVLPVILQDLVPNLVRNPAGVINVAGIARTADLEAELSELRHRRLPIVVLWGDRDLVLPRLSLQALHRAAGVECVTVPGGHEWLLADPKSFVEVLTNVVGLPDREQDLLNG